MIDFLIKFVLCSGFFIIVYKAIYEGAKLFQFQRFYLLLSLILCLVLPFIPMNKNLFGKLVQSPNKVIENVTPEFTGEIIYLEGNLATSNSLNTETILLIIYFIVTLFLLVRFSISLFKLLKQIHSAEKRKSVGYSIALVEQNIQPQSFFNYLLLNKTDFEQSGLPQEILTHEQCHIREKHSIDILLIQLLLVFFWFNPFLYLYRNALRQNHEFLADQTVIKSTNDKANYQHLLLNYLQTHQANAFTSPIQFSNLKKRMIMMNKKQSHQIKMVLVALVLPVLAFSVYAFTSEKPEEQVLIQHDNNIINEISDTIPPPPPPPPPMYADEYGNGVSSNELAVFERIIAKYNPGKERESVLKFKAAITPEDRNQLKSIFIQMNKSQQEQQVVKFKKPLAYKFPLVKPTTAEFESWKDATEVGLWIGDKKVSNSILNNYDATDFVHYSKSKLMKNAAQYGKYKFQVDAYTQKEYDAIQQKGIANSKNYEMIYTTDYNGFPTLWVL